MNKLTHIFVGVNTKLFHIPSCEGITIVRDEQARKKNKIVGALPSLILR